MIRRGGWEPNIIDTTEKVASLPIREDESSNPTSQIRYILDALKRIEEEEVSTPQRAAINVDNECASVAQLEEQSNLMDTDEIVGSFVNEPDIEAECEHVHAWRNWMIPHVEEIKNKL